MEKILWGYEMGEEKGSELKNGIFVQNACSHNSISSIWFIVEVFRCSHNIVYSVLHMSFSCELTTGLGYVSCQE